MPKLNARGMGAAALCALAIAAGPARAESPELPDPNYRGLRYNDDVSKFADPANRTDIFGKIKYIPIANGDWGPSYLSLGGEIRERSETYTHQNFGFKAPSYNSYVLQRLQINADLHLTDYFRLFAQFSDNERFGGRGVTSSTDIDRGDFTQAFVDVRLPSPLGDAPTLRAGREELLFGFQRDFSIDLLDVRPVNNNSGFLDDNANYAQRLWGGYLTMPIGNLTKADVYLLDYTNTAAKFRGLVGAEHRDTIGARVFGKARGFDWNFEAASQTGTYRNLQVRAYMLAALGGYTFESLPFTPRLGFSANYASGDDAHNKTTIGTFDPMYPRLPYFAETSQLVPANVKDFRAVFSFDPVKDVQVVLGWDNLWRASTTDGLYGSGLVMYTGSNASTVTGAKVGDELTVDARWQVDQHLSVGAIAAHFDVGPALSQTRPAVGQPFGRDENFYVLYAKYKF